MTSGLASCSSKYVFLIAVSYRLRPAIAGVLIDYLLNYFPCILFLLNQSKQTKIKPKIRKRKKYIYEVLTAKFSKIGVPSD